MKKEKYTIHYCGFCFDMVEEHYRSHAPSINLDNISDGIESEIGFMTFSKNNTDITGKIFISDGYNEGNKSHDKRSAYLNFTNGSDIYKWMEENNLAEVYKGREGGIYPFDKEKDIIINYDIKNDKWSQIYPEPNGPIPVITPKP
jgi:hypothetical protein